MRTRKSDTTTDSLIVEDVADRPSIACPSVMFTHDVVENEKYVLFATIGAFDHGGTSGPSTKASGSHATSKGARNAIRTNTMTIPIPIQVRTAGKLRRSSRSGKSTRPMIECRGIHFRSEPASAQRPVSAMGPLV